MGRRSSINEAQVFDAADTLVAQGREVTPNNLLALLGTGSFTTIYKYLATWEASRASVAPERASTIPEPVLAAFGTAWRVAATEAGRELAAIREQATEEAKAAKAQFQEALQTIEKLEEESNADAIQIEILTAKIAELELKLHKADSEKAASTATIEQLTNQVEKLEQRLQKTESELADNRKDKETARTEAAELKGKTAALESQNKDLLTRLSDKGKKQ